MGGVPSSSISTVNKAIDEGSVVVAWVTATGAGMRCGWLRGGDRLACGMFDTNCNRSFLVAIHGMGHIKGNNNHRYRVGSEKKGSSESDFSDGDDGRAYASGGKDVKRNNGHGGNPPSTCATS